MATIGATALTLADWAKRQEPQFDGIADIVELLSQTNEILDDMLWMEGNLPTGHQATVRTGLPTATWRLINQGVQPTKSTTAAITYSCGMMEAYSDTDKKLLNLNGNSAAFRLTESMAFLEGMNQQMASAFMYGNQAVNPERITGFSPYYGTATTANALSASNVVDAGGTASNNTSIWIVTWGPLTCHGIFPKGSAAGLWHKDLGERTKQFNDGSLMQVMTDHYGWDSGLVVRDWRYVVRIANIDVTLLAGGSAANLITLLIRATRRMPTTSPGVSNIQSSDTPSIRAQMGRTVIYCNRTIGTYLDIQALNKSNVLLSQSEWMGKPVTTFRGLPIRTVDAILNTEARVV